MRSNCSFFRLFFLNTTYMQVPLSNLLFKWIQQLNCDTQRKFFEISRKQTFQKHIIKVYQLRKSSSYSHSKTPWIIIEPISTEIAKPLDFIASPVQYQEHNKTQIKVTNLIWRDFLENICLIISFNYLKQLSL